MTLRSVSAIVFAIIVFVELVYFLSQPTPTTFIPNPDPNATGLFRAGYETIDYEAQRNQNQKNLLIIGSTILVGALVIFSLPNKQINKKNGENNNKDI